MSKVFSLDLDKVREELRNARGSLDKYNQTLLEKQSNLSTSTAFDNRVSAELTDARLEAEGAGKYYNEIANRYKDIPGLNVQVVPAVASANSFGVYGSFTTYQIPPEICTGFPLPPKSAEPISDPPPTKPVVKSPLAPSNPKPPGKKPKVQPPKTKGINKSKSKKLGSVKKPATIKGSKPPVYIPKPAPPAIAPAVMQAVPGGSLNGRPYTGIGPDKTMTK